MVTSISLFEREKHCMILPHCKRYHAQDKIIGKNYAKFHINSFCAFH